MEAELAGVRAELVSLREMLGGTGSKASTDPSTAPG